MMHAEIPTNTTDVLPLTHSEESATVGTRLSTSQAELALSLAEGEEIAQMEFKNGALHWYKVGVDGKLSHTSKAKVERYYATLADRPADVVVSTPPPEPLHRRSRLVQAAATEVLATAAIVAVGYGISSQLVQKSPLRRERIEQKARRARKIMGRVAVGAAVATAAVVARYAYKRSHRTENQARADTDDATVLAGPTAPLPDDDRHLLPPPTPESPVVDRESDRPQKRPWLRTLALGAAVVAIAVGAGAGIAQCDAGTETPLNPDSTTSGPRNSGPSSNLECDASQTGRNMGERQAAAQHANQRAVAYDSSVTKEGNWQRGLNGRHAAKNHSDMAHNRLVHEKATPYPRATKQAPKVVYRIFGADGVKLRLVDRDRDHNPDSAEATLLAHRNVHGTIWGASQDVLKMAGVNRPTDAEIAVLKNDVLRHTEWNERTAHVMPVGSKVAFEIHGQQVNAAHATTLRHDKE